MKCCLVSYKIVGKAMILDSTYKKTHHHKGCGWLASRRDSKYKKHIVAKDVVGLLIGDSKNDSLTKMKNN